jgi:hypothetical protein
MANQTVTTIVNYDDASISGLLNGETVFVDAGFLTVNSAVRLARDMFDGLRSANH